MGGEVLHYRAVLIDIDVCFLKSYSRLNDLWRIAAFVALH